MPEIDNLLAELEREKKEIKTDSYSMSIGEIINLYNEGDLELAPAYQRLFRWTDEQKSRFIESIFLGIPIPPIFVAQLEDGTWSVVDGVQRISTILQFTGNLSGTPLTLKGGSKLPSLEDFTWENLPQELKRTFRRSKFGINIILTQDSKQAQYELFQRLNTGGLKLEPQEIRNCLIIMLDNDFYNKINTLKGYQNFIEIISLPQNKLREEYHMELILRYFIAKHNKVDYEEYKLSSTNLADFFDRETSKLIDDPNFNIDTEIKQFKYVIDFIHSTLGKDAFKKYNFDKQTFEGAFSNACFEVLTTGLAEHFEANKNKSKEEIVELLKNTYQREEFRKSTYHGIKAIQRFRGLTDLSRSIFA